MNDWIDTPADVRDLVTIGGVLIAGLFWIVAAQVRKVVKESRTNGGSTMRDSVDRTELGMYAIYQELGELKGAINAHLDDHHRKEHAS